MRSHPSVSVIIPTWNRAATIVAAVESVLNQTHAPVEVLVCDDGSTDDTEARVRAIADPRVRWLPGPRGGRPAIPRNRGIAAAGGDWLAFLDSDDEWRPDKLASQLAALRASGRRACCTNALRVVPGHGPAGALHRRGRSALGLRELLPTNWVVCSSSLIDRSLIAQVEGFPVAPRLRAIEDYALWLRVACFTEFDYLPEPHVIYRDDPPNSVRAFDLDGWSQRLEIFNDFLGWCRRHPGMETRRGFRAGWRRLLREKSTRIVNAAWSVAVRSLTGVWHRLRGAK